MRCGRAADGAEKFHSTQFELFRQLSDNGAEETFFGFPGAGSYAVLEHDPHLTVPAVSGLEPMQPGPSLWSARMSASSTVARSCGPVP